MESAHTKGMTRAHECTSGAYFQFSITSIVSLWLSHKVRMRLTTYCSFQAMNFLAVVTFTEFPRTSARGSSYRHLCASRGWVSDVQTLFVHYRLPAGTVVACNTFRDQLLADVPATLLFFLKEFSGYFVSRFLRSQILVVPREVGVCCSFLDFWLSRLINRHRNRSLYLPLPPFELFSIVEEIIRG